MPTLVDTLLPNAGNVAAVSASARRPSSAVVLPSSAAKKPEHLFAAILTTSACLHFLFVGYLGYGIPADIPRLRSVRLAPLPPPIVENIQIQAPPPPKAQREVLRDQPPPATADLPAPTAAIAAVSSSVNVAFGIRAIGPVRLVSDASQATEGALGSAPALPQEVQGRSLLTPLIDYPAEALFRHYTGQVVIEFRTTPTGDIIDARIRSSSGHDVLDRAALQNLRLGRWTGEAGYFTKTYEFVLR